MLANCILACFSLCVAASLRIVAGSENYGEDVSTEQTISLLQHNPGSKHFASLIPEGHQTPFALAPSLLVVKSSQEHDKLPKEDTKVFGTGSTKYNTEYSHSFAQKYPQIIADRVELLLNGKSQKDREVLTMQMLVDADCVLPNENIAMYLQLTTNDDDTEFETLSKRMLQSCDTALNLKVLTVPASFPYSTQKAAVPVCNSYTQCTTISRNCSSHGACTSAADNCYKCSCTFKKWTDDNGALVKNYNGHVDWAGDFCELQDIAVSFHILLWVTFVFFLVFIAVVAMMWDAGEASNSGAGSLRRPKTD